MLNERDESELFKVKTGLLAAVDWTMRKTTAGNKTGVTWNVKTRRTGFCQWHSTHVIILRKYANKEKTTESICNKNRTKNK